VIVLGPSVHPLVRLFVCLFVCTFVYHETCEHDILKTNESVLLQISASVLWGKEMKLSTLGVMR